MSAALLRYTNNLDGPRVRSKRPTTSRIYPVLRQRKRASDRGLNVSSEQFCMTEQIINVFLYLLGAHDKVLIA